MRYVYFYEILVIIKIFIEKWDIYIYLWKYFSRQIYSYNFHICKLNNLKVIDDLYSQYLTQNMSKTTFFLPIRREYLIVVPNNNSPACCLSPTPRHMLIIVYVWHLNLSLFAVEFSLFIFYDMHGVSRWSATGRKSISNKLLIYLPNIKKLIFWWWRCSNILPIRSPLPISFW